MNGSTGPSPYVGLEVGPQFVRVDFGGPCLVSRVGVTHYFGEKGRVYRAVVTQLLANGEWVNVFNNDSANLVGQGPGSDATYEETYLGKTVVLPSPVQATAIRSWLDGSSANPYSQWSPPLTAFGVRVPANPGPIVDAGLSQTVTGAVASLYGSVEGGGSTIWLARSGPGTVLFADATSLETTATFSSPGTYVLELVATNGHVSGFGNLSVQVEPPPPTTPPPPPPPVLARDPTTWPFASNSPWNMPIGSGAQYESSGACTTAVTSSEIGSEISRDDYTHPIYVAKAADPLVEIHYGRYDYPAYSHVVTIRMPAGAFPARGTDQHLEIIERVAGGGYVVHEMWLARPPGSGPPFDHFSFWLAGVFYTNALSSSGIGQGGDRAYGGSGIGGLLRTGELPGTSNPSAGTIRHAGGFAMPQWLQKPDNPATHIFSWVWPATTDDGNGYNNYAGDARRGAIPMGALVALPPALFDLATAGVKTAQGFAIARMLRDFGAYDVDSTTPVYTPRNGSPTDVNGNNFTLYLERSAAGELNPAAIADLEKIRPYLRCVTNNRPDNIGGGGTPLVPTAPPLNP